MKKCKEVSNALFLAYQQKAEGLKTRFPKISLCCQGKESGEAFTLSYAGGIINVLSESPLALVYALSLLNVIVFSGHWHEFLGPSKPRFPLRPLWLSNQPRGEEALHVICRRLIELGYNAIVLDDEKMASLIPCQYGIKSILRVKIESEAKYLPGIDCIFFEGSQASCQQENHTLAESTLNQIRHLESFLQKEMKLIYFFPYQKRYSKEQNARTLISLFPEVDHRTIISFPAQSGDVCLDHLPPHPIWEQLRFSPEIQGTGLLPLFNTGAELQGEGLWPSVSLDFIDCLQNNSHRHSFLGAMGKAPTLPRSGGFLEANLWTMGQVMWRHAPSCHLLDSWMRAFKPALSPSEMLPAVKEVRALVLLLSHLRHEGGDDLKVEQAMSLVKALESRKAEFEKRRGKVPYSTFVDYMTYFLRDAKRIVKSCASRVNIEDDQQESLWTSASQKSSLGNAYLTRPFEAHPTSKITSIEMENCCLREGFLG